MWRRLLIRSSLGLLVFALIAEVGLRLVLGLGNPVLSNYDTACGYLITPNQDVERFGARNYINHYGMRSEEISENKPAGTFRILCLGDSVSYGTTFIDQSQIYTSRLEKVLADQHRHVEVLNASAGGWGPGNEVGYLQSRGTFQSDLVVLCLNPTDMDGDTNPGRLVLSNGSPQHRPALALEELWIRYAVPRMPSFGHSSQAQAAESSAQVDATVRAGVPTMLKEVGLAKSFANHAGAAFVLIYTPARHGDAGLDTSALHQAHDRLVAWARENSVPMVDVSNAFASYPPQEIFYDCVHLRVKGHQLIAQAFHDQWPTLASADLIQTQRDAILAAR